VPDSLLREEVHELLEAQTPRSKRKQETATATAHDLVTKRRTLGEQIARGSDRVGLPDSIGHYRIVRRLGTGSVGTVYEATENRPVRSVALKVLHADLVSAQGLRHFEREANALARLQHRGIAQIHAAGHHPTGSGVQPYIALELVDGLPLTDYANRHKLGLRARVALLLRVCAAVQHAHQRGILHRDLKPSNILVNAEGRPKVLDFSVACDTDADGAGLGSVRTGVVGTFTFMSPEQALGDPTDVDARTDVYALGAVGYLLLSGKFPIDLDGAPLIEAVRRLTEEWPPPLGSHRRELRGDLTAIFAKAMAKAKNERYASAAEFAEDLRRTLRFEPVSARAPTAIYRLGRFARRYRTLVASTALVVTMLVAGIVLALRAADTELIFRQLAEANGAEAHRAAYAASLQLAARHTDAGDNHEALRILRELAPENVRWEWRHVAAALGSDSESINLRASGLVAANASANGRWIVDIRDAGEVRLFDLDRGTRSLTQDRVARGASATAISNDGKRIFLAGPDGVVRARDGTWRDFARLDGVDGDQTRVERLELGGDGRYLAVAVCDRVPHAPRSRVDLIEVASGRILWSYRNRPRIRALAFDPRGARVAVGDLRGRFRVFDARSGETVWKHQVPVGGGGTARYSPDGRVLAVGTWDNPVLLLDAATGEVRHQLDLRESRARDLAISEDGSQLAVGLDEGVVELWNLRARPPRAERRIPVAGSDSWASEIFRLAWNDRARVVAAISRDALRLHALDTVPSKPVLRGHLGREEGNRYPFLSDVCFDPRGGSVASAGWDGTVRIWDTATNREVRTLKHDPGFIVDACRYVAGGARIVTHGRTAYRTRPTLYLWETDTGARLAKRTFPSHIEAMAYAAASNALAVCSGPDIHWLDADTLEPRSGALTMPGILTSCDYAAKPGVLFAGTASGICYLIRARDRTVLRSWRGHRGMIRGAAFDRDGRRLATVGTEDGSLRVWHVETGALDVENRGDRERYCVAWTRDGARLFVGSRNKAIMVVDATDGRQIMALLGHASYVRGVALSPDGAALASASGDNTVRLWHTESVSVRGRRMRAALESGANAPDRR
jgi:WD40 repeat protein